jgi:hypothetical protein
MVLAAYVLSLVSGGADCVLTWASCVVMVIVIRHFVLIDHEIYIEVILCKDFFTVANLCLTHKRIAVIFKKVLTSEGLLL